MSLDVSSHFAYKQSQTNPSSLVSVMTFANSDFSSRVTKYGSISRDASDVIGSNWSVDLENASRDFDSLRSAKTQFFQLGTFDIGFATESGTNDTTQIFGGELVKVDYQDSKVKLSFEDKLSRLKKIKVGDKKTPVSFTNTSVNPADLTWWVVTSFAGLSSIESTSNPDINYQIWSDWKAIFTTNNVLVQANFTGEKVTDIVQDIGATTDSVIYAEGDNKLYFNRWTGVASDSITHTDSHIIGKISLGVTGKEMVNKVAVNYDYNVSSDSFAGGLNFQNSDSVNSYGLHEQVYDSTMVWYVDSISAGNLAERVVFRKREPNITLKYKVPLINMNAQLGDEVVISTEVMSLNSQSYTLEEYKINWQKKEMAITLDEGFSRGGGRLSAFILDDVFWGLLDQTYNPLF